MCEKLRRLVPSKHLFMQFLVFPWPIYLHLLVVFHVCIACMYGMYVLHVLIACMCGMYVLNCMYVLHVCMYGIGGGQLLQDYDQYDCIRGPCTIKTLRAPADPKKAKTKCCKHSLFLKVLGQTDIIFLISVWFYIG